VPVDPWGDEPVVVRQEGDTPVYPVLKEVLGFEKRLKQVEEVCVSYRSTTHQT